MKLVIIPESDILSQSKTSQVRKTLQISFCILSVFFLNRGYSGLLNLFSRALDQIWPKINLGMRVIQSHFSANTLCLVLKKNHPFKDCSTRSVLRLLHEIIAASPSHVYYVDGGCYVCVEDNNFALLKTANCLSIKYSNDASCSFIHLSFNCFHL